MKLKIYRSLIIGVAGLIFALATYFLVLTIIEMTKQENIQDYIIMIVCFVLILALCVTHIANTIVSIKAGSSFIKPLVYDDDNTLNTKFIVFASICGVIALGVIIYFIFILCGFNLYFSNFIKPVSYLIVNVFILVLSDIIFILSFPYFGKDDPSFNLKKKKNRK